MQNLSQQVNGPVLDGVAIVNKLIQQIGSGGVTIEGTAQNILIKAARGVVVDGFAEVASEYNIVSTGSVEVSGAAFVEILQLLKVRIPYAPGDQVYTVTDCSAYTVQSYFYDLDDRIKFEISNGLTTLWVYDYDLTTSCNDLLLQQYSQADQMIKLLSA